MTPSVRGSRRIQVAALLTLSGAASGGLLGLVLGAGWTALPLPALSPVGAASIAALALSADLAGYFTGHPRPLSLHTQVPMQWARLFDLRTASILYGARLGIGPLTPMLSWTWWAAAAIGASTGSAESAALGASFGAVRMAIVVVAGIGAEPAMARRMGQLRRSEQVVVPVILAIVPVGWLTILRLAGS